MPDPSCRATDAPPISEARISTSTTRPIARTGIESVTPKRSCMASRKACPLTIAILPAISISTIEQIVPAMSAHKSANRNCAPAAAAVASAPASRKPPTLVVTPKATLNVFRMLALLDRAHWNHIDVVQSPIHRLCDLARLFHSRDEIAFIAWLDERFARKHVAILAKPH